MIVAPVYVLANPLALVLAVLDGYILTAAVYLIARRLLRGEQWCWRPTLERIITTPARFIDKRLALWRGEAVPGWQSWVVVFITVIVLRQLIAALIARMS